MFVSVNYQKEFIFMFFFSIIYIIKIFLFDNKIKSSSFYNYILNDLSQMSLFFIYFVEKKISRRKNKEYKIEENLDYTISERNEKINYKVIIFLFCISFFVFVFIYINIQEETPIDNLISIIITIIIDIIFFKKIIFLHHKISLFTLLLVLLIKGIYQFERFTNILLIPKIFLTNYSFSFSIFLIKYLNTYYFLNIYLIGGIVGIFNLIFDIILSLINSKLKDDFLMKKFNFLYLILLFFINFLYHFLFYQILYKLGPIQSLISIKFAMLIYCFYFFLKEEIIFNSIPILLTLLYLEIIVFNCCGINENIDLNVINRGEKGLSNLLNYSSSSDEDDK